MGMPVVFVHGMRVSGSMWRPQVEALRAQGRRVVAVDLPGHGVRRGDRFTVEGATAAVAEAVDGVGGRAVVVGLSLGGFVGIATAARYPERVAGLVAVSCTAQPVNLLARMYRFPVQVFDRLPGRGAVAVNERLFKFMASGEGADVALEGGFAVEAAQDVIEEVRVLDVVGLLAGYSGPVWLINGARDHFRIHEKRFLAACEDGRLLVVPRAGHMVSLDRPEEFTTLVADAVDVVSARGGGVESRRVSPPS
ncbi:alpha/beta hydrolase [Spiractinospora alimapuensis]|uniref:alpha/beta fold hydrolase n=1 Tax=Spiractinospora alimapuensis TaxID=2820884 RepID=UPI001F338CE0|nr:alpha/beta hydrolase [Spiractinospora alimapuensis]QVQ54607.1 alpha/beta hydrolase [Spiractinospora alimapuensis]